MAAQVVFNFSMKFLVYSHCSLFIYAYGSRVEVHTENIDVYFSLILIGG